MCALISSYWFQVMPSCLACSLIRRPSSSFVVIAVLSLCCVTCGVSLAISQQKQICATLPPPQPCALSERGTRAGYPRVFGEISGGEFHAGCCFVRVRMKRSVLRDDWPG